MATPAIGFLGLGMMAGNMARRLVASGYAVTASEAGVKTAAAPAWTPSACSRSSRTAAGAPIALSRKDVGLALTMAASLGMPMHATSAMRQVYETAMANGLGNLDMAAVTKLYEAWTGVEVRANR